MDNQLVKFMTDTGEVQLSPEIIKSYLVSGDPDKVTNQEVMMFLQLCKYQKLNPFLREAYLIKFGTAPATFVVGKEVFTKRASAIESCNGWQAGIVVTNTASELIYRDGSLMLPEEKLIGGWCKVFRKDWLEPNMNTVSLNEYLRLKSDGTPMSNWKNMPATMIMKVAIVQGLRNVFPENFQGMYSAEEMPIDTISLDTKPVNVKPAIQPTTTKSKGLSEPQIKRFYAIAKASGLGAESMTLALINLKIPLHSDGKIDWENVSKAQYDKLCSDIEAGKFEDDLSDAFIAENPEDIIDA
jgi:phage recombination protein Bet